MTRLRAIADDPVQLGFWTFTLALAIQLFHQFEHLAQIYQKHILHLEKFPGLLGSAFDFESVHFLYNSALFLSVLAVYIVYYRNPGIWRHSAVGHFALTFAVIFQSYHVVEHITKMIQYTNNRLAGMPAAAASKGAPGLLPGLLGPAKFPVVEFHFWVNSAIIGALLIAYFAFRPGLTAPSGKQWQPEAMPA